MKRKMTEATLIKKLNNLFPELKAMPLSKFYDDKSKEGIYCPELVEILDAAGWYCQPYDCETLTLLKDY